MENPFLGNGKADIARRLQPPAPDDTVQDYIEDSWGAAISVAPLIADEAWPSDPNKAATVKAIVRAIILRWHEAQSGALTGRTQSAGPYAQSVQLDQRPTRGYSLMPSEVVDLQRVCRVKGTMFSVDTMPVDDAVEVMHPFGLA